MAIKTRYKTIYQILNELNDITDKAERIEETRALCREIPTLQLVFQYAYHPDVKLDLPEEDIVPPAYKVSNHDEPAPLYRIFSRNELSKLNPLDTSLSKDAKYRVFITMLEKVQAGDAQILLGIKNKRLPQRRLTEKYTIEALPELFPNDFVGGSESS